MKRREEEKKLNLVGTYVWAWEAVCSVVNKELLKKSDWYEMFNLKRERSQRIWGL